MIHGSAETVAPAPLLHPALRRLATEFVEPMPRTFLFGAFVLQPERQLLLQSELPVRIGGRALDILIALVEQSGEVVTKQDLLAWVWPHVFVEEANLKANVALLRRVLGDGQAGSRFIATVVGRGYRFVSPVLAVGGCD